MKTLDRYLTRELIIPIFFCSLSLILLILIADLFDNLDDLIRQKTSVWVVAQYYLSLIPYAFTQTISWACWLGTIFLLISFGFHNETIAMKAAGLKITTIIKPVLFLGFLVGIITFLVSDRVVPKSTRKALELRQAHITGKIPESKMKNLENVTYYSGKDQIFFFRNFFPARGEVKGVIALWLGKKSNQSSRKKMLATQGRWENGQWVFENVTEYQMDSRGRILGEPQTFATKAYPEINFSSSELAIASTEKEFLSYRELKGAIQNLKENGVSVFSEKVDLHYRLATPWQGLVMMLLAIPFLAKTTNRRVIAMNLLFCVAFIFAYHVTSAVGVALGKAGKLFPFLSAWFGNIVFALGSLFYLEKANY